MSTKTKIVERNGTSKLHESASLWSKAFTANSDWPDKVRFAQFISEQESSTYF